MIFIFSTKILSLIANGNGFAVVNPALGALRERVFVPKLETALVTLTPLELTVGTILRSSLRLLSLEIISTLNTELLWRVVLVWIFVFPIATTIGADV